MHTIRRSRRPWTGAAPALAITVALGITACGSPDGESASGATLTVASPMSISSIDPHGPGSGDRPTITVAQHIFDTLVVRDGSDFNPSLATSWENPDPLTWRFELNPDATFHDGSPVTAQDVVASQARLVELGGPLAAQWAPVESVTAEGEHSVVITTGEPHGTLLGDLALLFIAPQAGMEDPDFFQDPVGSGPFTVEQIQLNDRITLGANEDYWGDVPSIDTLVIRDMPEVSSLVAAVNAGEVDLTWGIPPDQMAGLAADDSLTVESLPSFVYYMNWFNSSREPFDDVRVRQALWHAVDLRSLVDDLFPDAAEVATAPIPSTVFGHSEQQPYAHDPDRARQLLADAGYPDGFEVALDLSVGGGPQIRQIAQTLISGWAEVGVTVKLAEKERAVWLDDLLALNWDMNLLINAVLTGDADFTLGRLYPSTANRTGYSNPELDKVLADAKASLDADERDSLYATANTIIWEDAVGMFPMEMLATYAWRDGVSGFVPDPNETPRFTTVIVD